MQGSQFLGVFCILFGVAVLVILGSFILSIIEFIIMLAAVLIGILLIIGGIALLLGGRWMKRRPWGMGPPPAST